MFHDFSAGSIDCSLDDWFVVDSILSNLRLEKLISGLIAREENQAPDEIGEKPTDQDDG